MNATKHSVCLLFGAFLLVSGYAQTNPGPTTVQVSNENAVNTAGLEFSPAFYEDGIAFISTNTVGMKKITDESLKLSAMSILRSRRNAEGLLSAPEPFARELVSLYHEGPVCFDRTAETVYFSRNVMEKGREKLAEDGSQKMRLYSSTKVGGVWSEPKPLPFNTGEFDDCHPTISIDGDKLYFSSNRPGSFGGMDIFVSYKVGDSWSEPVNLGPIVNTKGNEVFPFIHADNSLYFASTGHEGGLGGLDIYYVTPDGQRWTKPINLGNPFNTPGDDFGLIVDLNKINGYFSSNGTGGLGGDDIFSFHTENGNLDDYLLQNKRAPTRQLDLKVVVIEKKGGAAVADASVQITDEAASNAIGRDEAGNLIGIQQVDGQDVIRTLEPGAGANGVTDAKGMFMADVKTGNYILIVSKKGYQTKQLRLPLTKPGNEVQVALEKVGPGPGKMQWNASVFNYVTNAPMAGTTLVMTNKNTNRRDTVVTDANGLIDSYVDRSAPYHVDIYQAGRLVGSTELETSNTESMLQNISVAPLLPGTTIELPNIYYNFNDATLRPDGRKDLDLVAALMTQHPGIAVEMASHTDCRGSANYNRELSQKRANGVVDYLVSRGIARPRLRPVGYGESQPRNGCVDGVKCDEPEHARNRRTEIKIITGVQGASVIYVDGQVAGIPPAMTNDAAVAAPAKTKAKPAAGAKTKPQGNVSVSTADVEYHVIAGSFLMEERARNQASTLNEAGFSNTEVIQFPNSPFYSVSVSRFASRNEAQALERRLKSEKFEAFVRAVPRG